MNSLQASHSIRSFSLCMSLKNFMEVCLWQNPSSEKNTGWTNILNHIKSQHEDKLRKSTTYGELRFAPI